MGEIGTERSDLLFLTRKHRSFSFIYPLYSLKSFSELGLREELLTAISEMGYENPTPVQEAVIPVLLHNPSFPNTLIPTANDSEDTSEEASVMSEEASAISAEGADITEAAEESNEVIAEMTANADFDTEVSAERHKLALVRPQHMVFPFCKTSILKTAPPKSSSSVPHANYACKLRMT